MSLGNTTVVQILVETGLFLSSIQDQRLAGTLALLLMTVGDKMAWHVLQSYKVRAVGVRTLDKGQTHFSNSLLGWEYCWGAGVDIWTDSLVSSSSQFTDLSTTPYQSTFL